MENNKEFDQEFWNAAGRHLSGEEKGMSSTPDFENIKKVWDSAAGYEYAETSGTDEQWNLLKSKLHVQTVEQTPVLQVTHRRTWIRWSVAAAVVLVAGIATFYFSGVNKPAYAVEVFEYKGKAGVNTPVQLPDGSSVLLRGNSSITLSNDFGQNTRTLSLNGEAKFEVAKDPEHPFVVNASGTSTTVLGTGFDINSFDKSAVRIQVLHGKVAFASKTNPAESVTLELGDGATFDSKSEKISSANNAAMTQWESGKIVFTNTPLSEVARDFEATYGKQLLYPAEASNRPFNGTLMTANSPELFAEILSTALKVKVSVK